MAFAKGQSGNPGGRAREKLWREAVLRAVRRKFEGDDDQALERVADALVKAASDGDIQAIKEIGDRVDGKPAQAIIGGDEDDPALRLAHVIEMRIVDPKN